jgi:hypothetical protein
MSFDMITWGRIALAAAFLLIGYVILAPSSKDGIPIATGVSDRPLLIER